MRLLFLTIACLGLIATERVQAQNYKKRATRAETAVATLKAFEVLVDAKWHYAGPFDNRDNAGFEAQYAPEKGVDLTAKMTGKDGQQVTWKELPKFEYGKIYDLAKLFPGKDQNNSAVYLTTEIENKNAVVLPLYLGSDDTLTVYLGKNRLMHENYSRPAAPDQDRVDLRMSAGKHRLLIKVCQSAGGWEFYACPGLPDTLPPQITKSFARDFPMNPAVVNSGATGNENLHYAISTLNQPADCVLEVGGLAFRPDGKLLACTRRGEVWLIENPAATNPDQVKFRRFASGLHESLGIWTDDNNSVYVVQRPELTKLVDKNHDDQADEFVTVCNRWGVSGDYHEFAFGPARDRDGNFFITLNVGFGGGHQAKAPWRGWCVKVDPKTGSMEPWAYGLRSPNGINFAPDGELFYCDNQGEWVATNKMNHIRRGQFYGHQAGLKWVKDSPFAKNPDKIASGMRYDAVPPPALDPPCIWFPYGRMGQSASEPQWDTTQGKFGPFAGQCFVGDQTRSMVMRVALEKVNGVFQGACFPFRSGLQCGVNRIVFGPDGSMYVGQTNRGWGSVGGKPYGLQRIAYTGDVPFEVHDIAITNKGFDINLTKPVDPATIKDDIFVMKSFTYVYASQYGYPETDTQPEKATVTGVSADGKRISLAVPDRKKGRLYDFRFVGLKSAKGEDLLHAEAYYTLNEIPAK